MAKIRRAQDLGWEAKVQSSKDKGTQYMSAILFGGYGTGKTRFAASWPKPFFICAEDGMLTLKGEDVPYILLDPEFAINKTVLDIFAHAANREGIFKDVETIVIDSMSKLNQMVKDEILEEVGKEKPEFDEWGKLRVRMNAINNLFVRLPYNRLIIVSESYKEDKYTKELKPVFNIEGGFRDDLAGEYDNVWIMAKKQVGRTQKFVMNTEYLNGREAKKRLELPAEIENVSYTTLTELIK